MPIKRELDNSKTITYKLNFIISLRFMSSKLSDLLNNLSEVYNNECRGCKERKTKSICNFIGLRKNKLHYKCKECKKIQLKPKNGLIKKFPSTYKFYNGDINKFVLLLRKVVYPYE